MKNRKKYLVIGISIPLICCLIVIYMFFVRTEAIKVTWMPTPDGQEQINEYIKAGHCTSGYVADDNSYAEIRLTEWQRRKWLDFLYYDVEDFLDCANDIDYMKMEVSADTKEMIVYADREVNFQTLATYLGIISWNIEMIQILNGEADWGFRFTAKDMKTEKILYQVDFPEEKIKLYEYYWDEIEE